MLELIKPFNFILAADSYKAGHWLEIPEHTQKTYSAIVPRKASPYATEIVAMGQAFVAEILSKVRITEEMMDEAEMEINEQGYTFNRKGWEIIVRDYGGRLPLAMFGVEEGRVVAPQTPVVGLVNTDEVSAWLPAYVESWVHGTIWKMSTVASICRKARFILKNYMAMTGSDMTMLDYKLHNFGDRAAGSPEESVVLAGIAHAALFSGSDCLRANSYIKKLYRTHRPYLSSVEAFEHSTICANSIPTTKDDYLAALKAVERLEAVVESAKNGIGIPVVSVVIDTYDDERFVSEYLGTKLKDRIVNSGGTMVARPDSGDPALKPGQIGQILIKKFGCTTNSLGYVKLPPCVGVLQGDGVRITTIESVVQGWVQGTSVGEGGLGFCLDGFLLGMGSGTTNDCQRDDFSWSMKAIANKYDGVWKRLLKDPISDPGKKSLSGLIRCRENENGELEVFDAMTEAYCWNFEHENGPGWRLWSEDGARVYRQTFEDVRARARKGL